MMTPKTVAELRAAAGGLSRVRPMIEAVHRDDWGAFDEVQLDDAISYASLAIDHALDNAAVPAKLTVVDPDSGILCVQETGKRFSFWDRSRGVKVDEVTSAQEMDPTAALQFMLLYVGNGEHAKGSAKGGDVVGGE